MYAKTIAKRKIELIKEGIDNVLVRVDGEEYVLKKWQYEKLNKYTSPHVYFWFDSNGKLITVTSLEWRPVDNEKFAEVILKILGSNADVVICDVDDVELRLLAKLRDVKIPDLGSFTIAVHNINDGRHALRIFNGFTVYDCDNVVFVGSEVFRRRIIHLTDRVNIKRLELLIKTDIRRNIVRFIRIHEDLRSIYIEFNDAVRLLEYFRTKNLLPKYITEDVVDDITEIYLHNDLTLWDLLMTITYYTTRSKRIWNSFGFALYRITRIVNMLEQIANKHSGGVVYDLDRAILETC